MRRVDCLSCGVRVELAPWAEGRNHLTKPYAWFLAHWAKRTSGSDAGAAFRTTSSTGSALEVSSRRVPSRASTARCVSSRNEPTDSARTAPSKSPCNTALGAYPSRTSPTDSAEEPKKRTTSGSTRVDCVAPVGSQGARSLTLPLPICSHRPPTAYTPPGAAPPLSPAPSPNGAGAQLRRACGSCRP